MKKILTGNEILDTVLAVKQNISEQENIAVSYNGSPLNISFMEPVDICTLFTVIIQKVSFLYTPSVSKKFQNNGAKKCN